MNVEKCSWVTGKGCRVSNSHKANVALKDIHRLWPKKSRKAKGLKAKKRLLIKYYMDDLKMDYSAKEMQLAILKVIETDPDATPEEKDEAFMEPYWRMFRTNKKFRKLVLQEYLSDANKDFVNKELKNYTN